MYVYVKCYLQNECNKGVNVVCRSLVGDIKVLYIVPIVSYKRERGPFKTYIFAQSGYTFCTRCGSTQEYSR